MSGGPASLYLKLGLLVMGLIIGLGTYFYTQLIVQRLQERERELAELYASSFEFIADPMATGGDYTFRLDVIRKIDFPLILVNVDSNGEPVGDVIHKNLNIDSALSKEKQNEVILEKLAELEAISDPIPVFYENILLSKIYYGDSELIKRLQYYPYLQIMFAFIFIIISYISFSYLKKNEQSNIWVGMAKETAHQLGTPISSLMGWKEILVMNFKNPDKVQDVANEMSNDLARLTKIANRFSKIGSRPELKSGNVYDIISVVIEYFNRRIPQTHGSVQLNLKGDKKVMAMVNADLFEWVVENLVKNALDAIGSKKNGKINLIISNNEENIDIDVTDNGKGIELNRRSDVFRPGYSTKKRGWGLGLSLARRIIVNYHSGKLFVKNSVIDEGTTFQISLKKSPKSA
jgi:hypothetical protein